MSQKNGTPALDGRRSGALVGDAIDHRVFNALTESGQDDSPSNSENLLGSLACASCPLAEVAGVSGASPLGSHLRPYQEKDIARIQAAIAAGRLRVLYVAPTGSGKMVVAAALIAAAISNDQRALFLAHRRELIQQASRNLFKLGVEHGIIQAGFPNRPGERVQVASIQTLHARAVRTRKIELPPADLVIVDEAHHCPARTYRQLIRAYPQAVILGMTATPCRSDGRGLGKCSTSS
jgi:superfamily II DNA or RNA helicase